MAPLTTIDELESRLTEIRSRLQEIDTEHAGEPLPDEKRDEWNQLNDERDRATALIAELNARSERITQLAQNPENRENEASGLHTSRPGKVKGNDIYDLSTIRSAVSNPSEAARELRERAKRAVEGTRLAHPDVDQAESKEHVDDLLDRDAEDGRLARYMLATGSPIYKRAFSKYLAGQQMTREEQMAAEQVQGAERALSLTGSAGGFAVPFELDPTVLNTSNGVINPIRQVARVRQISVDEWRGVTSTGITASYQAEATETTDNAPTLAQPTVSTEKAQAWVPFSIEAGMDWSGLRTEMAELLQDAKDTLEASKFVSGTGTNEPFGVVTGTTNTVNAAGGQTFTLANLYSLQAALPPRYRAMGSYLGDLQIAQRVRQFDTVGSSAAIWSDSLQDDNPSRLLGKPFYEASEMADSPSTGSKFLVYGDFSRYLIADRIGLNVEVVPHVFGANQRPTGQRGLYAYWRNGAKVIDANAFRTLLGVA